MKNTDKKGHKGIYNRLALIKCYLLDMDLALYAFCLPSLVKFIKSWIYFVIMKLDFTQIKGMMKKVVERLRFEPVTIWSLDQHLSEHSYCGLLKCQKKINQINSDLTLIHMAFCSSNFSKNALCCRGQKINSFIKKIV